MFCDRCSWCWETLVGLDVAIKQTYQGQNTPVDEAQRSWTHKRLADYLKRGGTYSNKLKVPNSLMSKAAFLIWALGQRED